MVGARLRAPACTTFHRSMTGFLRPCLILLAVCGLMAGCARRELQPGEPGLLPPSQLVAPVVVAGEGKNAASRPDVSALGTLAELQQRLPANRPEAASRE